MAAGRYISLEQRAAWLIEKGTRTWQQIQHFAMSEDELDSLVLLGMELWLPHHETDGTKYEVTLRVGVHYPEANREAVEERAQSFFREVEEKSWSDQGRVSVLVEIR